jgi:radical SAM superfamily enzyme YgiQ (UPF0313 family)
MYDIIIINLPGLASLNIPAAPALLKASIEKNGFKCKTIDFNIKFNRSDLKNKKELEQYFILGLNQEIKQEAVALIQSYIDELLVYTTRYVGISVFTYQNKIATTIFCEELRKKSKVKIILGGQGLADGGILGPQGYAKTLYSQDLIDYYIKSEGEISLVELLKDNFSAPGINSDEFQQIKNLNIIPTPDYSDYQLELYDNYMPITGSRGCVRSCSFCDIHDHWSYTLRSGVSIANEVIDLYLKHNIKKFRFTDSLINGSLKEFKTFCEILASFNLKNKEQIKYTGQYIVRSSSQLDDKYWRNLADSGAEDLAIGVETGSDRVRMHMNKKFTNVDLDYTMTMLDKYNITCQFLMLFGYPTETQEDFQETLDMFKKYQKYANTIITNVSFGSTLAILPGTPLFSNAKKYNIELDKHENNWIAYNNPELTLAERIRRRHAAKDHVLTLGYKLNQDETIDMLHILDKHIPKFEKRNTLKKLIKIKALK